MNRTRPGVVAIGAAAFCGCVVILAPGYDQLYSPGAELFASVEDGERLSQALDADRAAIRREFEARRALGSDLAAGRTTLAHAADAHLVLNRARAGHLVTLRAGYPGRSDHECAARQAIAYARSQAPDPEIREEVGRRLEEEFAAAYPDAPPLDR